LTPQQIEDAREPFDDDGKPRHNFTDLLTWTACRSSGRLSKEFIKEDV
jgi:hypothetical protein